MLDLIYMLTALQIFCKDAHYNTKGINFKPLHEWMDEIGEPVSGWLDDIKENCLLANDIEVPRGIEINEKAVPFVPTDLSDNEKIVKGALAILETIHRHINTLNGDKATEDLLGSIDSAIVKQVALLKLAGK